MLVLSRKVGERIMLGDNIVLTVVRISDDKVRLGIEAPPELKILREELLGEEKRIAESGKRMEDQKKRPLAA